MKRKKVLQMQRIKTIKSEQLLNRKRTVWKVNDAEKKKKKKKKWGNSKGKRRKIKQQSSCRFVAWRRVSVEERKRNWKCTRICKAKSGKEGKATERDHPVKVERECVRANGDVGTGKEMCTRSWTVERRKRRVANARMGPERQTNTTQQKGRHVLHEIKWPNEN